jgi:hypothetical protein
MMLTNGYIFFTESELTEIENKEDINFLVEFKSEGQSLISPERNKFRVNFVGEVITPNNIYFSLPKNLPETEDGVKSIKKVLIKYSKDRTGKSLAITQLGSYNSERAYFDRLKEYFLDYITYEFIYPLKRKLIHSNSPISGARVSIQDTTRNRKRFGTGVTYKTKDVENSDDWMIDDIYYHTLKELEERLRVSEYERNQISSMKKYLEEEGYNFNRIEDNKIYSNKTKKLLLDLSDSNKVVDKIKSSEVGVIHNPIKNILLEYYGNKQKASARSSVNVIFTQNFEKVWEMILQDALEDDLSKDLKDELKNNFNKTEISEDFIPRSELEKFSHKLIINPKDKENLEEWIETRGERYFLCKKFRILIPDIFVVLKDGRKFIGDAKYYKDPSNANYDKEFYIYNDAQGNKYPMVIFALPEEKNIDETIVPRNGYRRSTLGSGGVRELILITVCVKDVIEDALSDGKSRKVREKSIYLIEKYTRKPGWRK